MFAASFVYTWIVGVAELKVNIVESKAVPSVLDREYVKVAQLGILEVNTNDEIVTAGSFSL